MSKIALIVGASGLVGGYCLDELLNNNNYSKVIAITRKPLGIKHDKLIVLQGDLDSLQNIEDKLVVDDVFCCLGTTIKTAGSKAAFRRVDFDYPLEIAKITQKNGAKKFALISAMGANKNSFIFYNQVKGEIQEAINNLNFESFNIIQPSLIMGERNEKRMGEAIAQNITKVINPFFKKIAKKYAGVEAKDIAKSMVIFMQKDIKGMTIFTSDKLHC